MRRERTSIGLDYEQMRALEARAAARNVTRAHLAAEFVGLVLEGPEEWVRRQWEAAWGVPTLREVREQEKGGDAIEQRG